MRLVSPVMLQEHFEKLKTSPQGGRISGSKARQEQSCKGDVSSRSAVRSAT